MKGKWKELALFVGYILFILIQNSHHELWRDEIHSWYIVKSSSTILELWKNVDYEGHPFGWYTILFVAKQFYNGVQVQAYIHLFFTFGLAYFIIFKSPFSFIFKLLLLFGFFFGYEYSILQRNYTPAFFLIFWSFSSFLDDKKILPYVLLLLAGFINIHAFILAVLLYAFYITEQHKAFALKKIIPHIIILAVYTILFYIDIKPNATNVDMHYELQWTTGHFRNMLFAFCEGIIKASSISGKLGLRNLPIAIFTFLAILIVPLYAFRKNWKVSLLWTSSLITFFVFWLFFFKPYWRHSGHIWVILILCSWYYIKMYKNVKLIYAILIPLCILRLELAYKAIKHDYLYPVSQIENVAEYLRTKDKNTYQLVGDIDYCTSPIGCLIGKEMHYPQSPKRHNFIQYTHERIVPFDATALKAYADSIGKDYKQEVILICNRELTPLKGKAIAVFKHPETRLEENFYLYSFPAK